MSPVPTLQLAGRTCVPGARHAPPDSVSGGNCAYENVKLDIVALSPNAFRISRVQILFTGVDRVLPFGRKSVGRLIVVNPAAPVMPVMSESFITVRRR